MFEIEAARTSIFCFNMEKELLQKVVEEAAARQGCSVVSLSLDEDNVIEVVIDREDAPVELSDCETVHRAVLAAFDRDVEDYALTVSSLGIDAEEADELLKTIND